MNNLILNKKIHHRLTEIDHSSLIAPIVEKILFASLAGLTRRQLKQKDCNEKREKAPKILTVFIQNKSGEKIPALII